MGKNGKKRPVDPQREMLERDLVVHDKQKLISECLKLYDVSMMLQQIISTRNDRIGELSSDILNLNKEKGELSVSLSMLRSKVDSLRWWQLLFNRKQTLKDED